MTTFTSPESTINKKREEVFSWLTDFNNFERLMPDQVSDWKSSETSCSFRIQNMATLEMKMGSHEPNSKIEYLSFGSSPLSFTLTFQLQESDNDRSIVKVILDADLNPMLKMMASRPLQSFVNVLAEKLPEVFGS